MTFCVGDLSRTPGNITYATSGL